MARTQKPIEDAAALGVKSTGPDTHQGFGYPNGVSISLHLETIHPKKLSVKRRGERQVWVYSAKFICGSLYPLRTPGSGPHPWWQVSDPLSPGTYLTAINILNPHETPISFRKRATLANPEQKPKPVPGRWVQDQLEAYQAVEVSWSNIATELLRIPRFSIPHNFITGFVIIESAVELEIVGVYTVKNTEPPQ